MEAKEKNVKYPQNLYLKGEIDKSGMRHDKLAEQLNIDKQLLSRTINGHYLGKNIKPRLLEILSKVASVTA
jgi:hypothetical protein